MRFAISKINANSSILHGIKLYAKIYDTCSSKMDHILGLISFNHIMGLLDSAESEQVFYSVTKVAVFNMILISYTAVSSEWDDRIMFGNFFRTIPSDDPEMHALADLIRFFNWSYVSVLNSHGYKQQSAESLIAKLGARICVASHIALPKSAVTTDYNIAISKLLAQSKADVIVVIATVDDTMQLLHAVEANPEARQRFTLITGTKLLAYRGFVEGAKRAATGLISLSLTDMRVKEFDEHVESQETNYLRYDWLRLLMPKLLNCTLRFPSIDGLRLCTGKEKVDGGLSQMFRHLSVKAVINIVHTVACSLRKYIEKNCFPKNLTTSECKAKLMEWYNPKDPRIEMLTYYQSGNTVCPELPYSVNFDATGSYHRDFDILNFDGEDFRTVGHWKLVTSERHKGVIQVNEGLIHWKQNKTIPVSQCSTPCNANEIKIFDLLFPQCCFTCKPCNNNSIVLNNTCFECPIHQKPSENRSHCYNLPVLSINHVQVLPVMIIFSSVIGSIATTIVAIAFAVFRKNQIIKASSREISVVILSSLYTMHIASILFVVNATVSICAVRRIIVGVSLTSCYSALMLKTSRIYRIFKAASSVSSPTLVSSKSQIFICLSFLALQVLLGLTWLFADPVLISTNLSEDRQHVVFRCKENSYNFFLNLLPCSIFMLQCTFYAYKTRRFPENFNEAASIGYTMYLNCILWAVFIPVKLWLQSDMEYLSDFAAGIFSSLIGLVSVFGLFGPKVYRVLFKSQTQGTIGYFFSSHASTVSTVDQR